MEELTHISLFAGIGGIDLAAEWAGFRTILFVEIDPFCQKVLRKHWPGVPIIGDIRDATKETLDNTISGRCQASNEDSPRSKDNQRISTETGDGRQYDNRRRISTVTLVTGGFPCQPVSQAGKRRGEADDRWLWPEMLRVISEVRPTWVVAENVTGLLTMGFYDCLSDLEGQGYETIPFVIPACAVNAPHRRDRIFIVANTEGSRIGQELGSITGKLLSKDRTPQEFESSSGDVAKPSSQRCENIQGGSQATLLAGRSTSCDRSWWDIEPDVGRVAHGIPHRVDRLRCLGNAVVPQQIYPILQAIADIERTRR